jgi:hypothetical protein
MIPFLFAFVRLGRSVKGGAGDPEFRALATLVGGTLLIGAWFYHIVEGWSLLDSVYFCVTTLATVGFGDLAPKHAIARLFTIAYVFIGIGLLATFFQRVAQKTVTRRVERTEQRHTVSRQQEGVVEHDEC